MSSPLELGVLPEAVVGSAWHSQDTRNTVSPPSEQRESGRPPSLPQRLCPTALLTWTRGRCCRHARGLETYMGLVHTHTTCSAVCMQHTEYTQVDLVTSKETYWIRGPFMSPDIFYIRKNLQSSSPRCQSLNGPQSGEGFTGLRQKTAALSHPGGGVGPDRTTARPLPPVLMWLLLPVLRCRDFVQLFLTSSSAMAAPGIVLVGLGGPTIPALPS